MYTPLPPMPSLSNTSIPSYYAFRLHYFPRVPGRHLPEPAHPPSRETCGLVSRSTEVLRRRMGGWMIVGVDGQRIVRDVSDEMRERVSEPPL